MTSSHTTRVRYSLAVHGVWNHDHYGRPRRSVPTSSPPTLPPLRLSDMITRERLLQQFRRDAKVKGIAPGPDGITYTDLSPTEAAAACGRLAALVHDGTYRPGPSLPVDVPKPFGRGTRTLHLRNIVDRVLSGLLAATIEPVVDPTFHDRSYGFRPGRSTHQLLARLAHEVVSRQHFVVTTADIRNAFGCVPIDLAVRRLGAILSDFDPFVVNLAAVVLRGHDARRTTGIDQGDPLSPLGLNVVLHHCLDRHLDGGPGTPPWYRYADDLTYTNQSVSEAQSALRRTRELLRPHGFQLGRVHQPVDLRRGGSVSLLGFDARLVNDRVVFQCGRSGLEGLRYSLEQAHEAYDVTGTARSVVRGWIESRGPGFEDVRDDCVLDVVLREMAAAGHREPGSILRLRRGIQAARWGWLVIRREAEQ